MKVKRTNNVIIAEKIFMRCCEFSKITFTTDSTKKEEIDNVCKELMFKLSKVVDELECFRKNKLSKEKEMLAAAKSGTTALPTHELAKNIENFLTQAKGTLDIFAKQFLGAMFGFDGKWHYRKIVNHLRNKDNLDKNTVAVMENTLEKENNEWLKDFIDDRNWHHEENLGLSPMYIQNQQPFMKLTRRNGEEVTDVLTYLRFHYNKVFHLIEYLMRLSFCAVNPAWRVIYLSDFVSPFENV
jgi:hypothetical protein